MNDRQKKKEELKRRSRESRLKTDALLSEEIQALKKASISDLEKLRPKVNDKESYDELIAAVKESIDLNEDIGELTNRLKSLSKSTIKITKDVVKLLTLS